MLKRIVIQMMLSGLLCKLYCIAHWTIAMPTADEAAALCTKHCGSCAVMVVDVATMQCLFRTASTAYQSDSLFIYYRTRTRSIPRTLQCDNRLSPNALKQQLKS